VTCCKIIISKSTLGEAVKKESVEMCSRLSSSPGFVLEQKAATVISAKSFDVLGGMRGERVKDRTGPGLRGIMKVAKIEGISSTFPTCGKATLVLNPASTEVCGRTS